MTQPKKLKLKIFDNEYSLIVENEEIAKELASYVSKVMDETRHELPDQSIQTIAILSALNIAYELFQEKNKSRDFSNSAIDKIKKIKLLLNESQLTSVPS
jgi:cell division protein ZapA